MTDQDDDDQLVVLDVSEARLIVHLLAVFERLLRQGCLSESQLQCLMGTGVGPVDASADIIMAGVVSEASMPVRGQLP